MGSHSKSLDTAPTGQFGAITAARPAPSAPLGAAFPPKDFFQGKQSTAMHSNSAPSASTSHAAPVQAKLPAPLQQPAGRSFTSASRLTTLASTTSTAPERAAQLPVALRSSSYRAAAPAHVTHSAQGSANITNNEASAFDPRLRSGQQRDDNLSQSSYSRVDRPSTSVSSVASVQPIRPRTETPSASWPTSANSGLHEKRLINSEDLSTSLSNNALPRAPSVPTRLTGAGAAQSSKSEHNAQLAKFRDGPLFLHTSDLPVEKTISRQKFGSAISKNVHAARIQVDKDKVERLYIHNGKEFQVLGDYMRDSAPFQHVIYNAHTSRLKMTSGKSERHLNFDKYNPEKDSTSTVHRNPERTAQLFKDSFGEHRVGALTLLACKSGGKGTDFAPKISGMLLGVSVYAAVKLHARDHNALPRIHKKNEDGNALMGADPGSVKRFTQDPVNFKHAYTSRTSRTSRTSSTSNEPFYVVPVYLDMRPRDPIKLSSNLPNVKHGAPPFR